MERLVVPVSIFDEMLAHCKQGRPNEACGILAGKAGEVSKIYKMTNVENSPVIYEMDSRELFKVTKEIRENRLSLLAIFHSHPATPAYPSKKDISIAFYEDAIYIIISLREETPEVRGFTIREGAVTEAEVIVR